MEKKLKIKILNHGIHFYEEVPQCPECAKGITEISVEPWLESMEASLEEIQTGVRCHCHSCGCIWLIIGPMDQALAQVPIDDFDNPNAPAQEEDI